MPSASTTAAPGMSATSTARVPATPTTPMPTAAPAPTSTHAPASPSRASTTAVASPSSLCRRGLPAATAPPVAAPTGLASHRCRAGRGPVVTILHRPIPHGEGASTVEAAPPSRTAVADRSAGPTERSGLGRAETRSISAERDVRPEPAPVVQRRAVRPGPQAVHEVATPVQVGLVDPRAVEEGPVDVRPEAEAKGKAEPIRRVEDRVVADERIVEKRIVARAVKAVVVRPTPAIAVTEAHRRRIVRVVVAPIRFDHVRHNVVVEVPVGSHALDHVEQRRFLVVTRVAHVEHAVIPVVAAHELVELERGFRPGGKDNAGALAVVHVERLAIAATAHLDGLMPAHERVVARIEREQHAHAPVRIGAEDDDIAVIGEPDVHPGLVAASEIIVVVEPDFDGGIITSDGRNRSVGSRQAGE